MENTNNPQSQEGEITKKIETQAVKLPSDIFLLAAITSMAVSLTFQLTGSRHRSLFIGQWAAPFLLLGIYNKLVKQQGHSSEY